MNAMTTPPDSVRANLPACLAGLNESQLEAATTTEGYLRVIAGAGTGKTRLLTHRFAYLVEGLGIDPANICCVTFTNKAAGEMRQRIRTLLGDGFDTSLVCTFHSLATNILRRDIDRLFWPKSFQVIDRDQQKEVMADVYERLELKMDAGSFEKILEKAGALKGNPDYLPGMLDRQRRRISPSAPVSEDDRIVEAYLQQQKRDFLLDFDDLLVFAQHLLDTCPDVRDFWQAKLNYIQVDEFQDTDGQEMRFVDTLAGYYGNLMVVGDPDQNIYEWRGSNVELLLDFDKLHSPCATVLLTRNYRSTPQILTCANELIAHNELRIPKDLCAVRGGDAPVVHLHAANESDETTWVAARIAQLHEKGLPYGGVAVLYRASWASRAIEKRLMDEGIPYEIVGGARFMRRMEIADTVAYLRLVAFDDDYAFKRIVNVPRRKMGKARTQRLAELQASDERASGDHRSLFATLVGHLGDEAFKGSGARRFVSLIEELRERMGRLGVADFVDLVLSATGYEAYVRELGNMERLDNLAEFKRMARAFEAEAGEEVGMYDFLDMLALQGEAPSDEGDRVHLMTVHAAKGLEFPCVFLMGMTEGIFPSARTVEEHKALGLEEERRLCYVALTRARDLLVMTDSEGFTGARAVKLPSRFLFEMGEKNYVREGMLGDDLARQVRTYLANGALLGPRSSAALEGQRIVHPVFGPGTVGPADDSGTSHRVNFDGLPTPRSLNDTFLARLVEEQHASPGSVAVAATVEAVVEPKGGSK